MQVYNKNIDDLVITITCPLVVIIVTNYYLFSSFFEFSTTYRIRYRFLLTNSLTDLSEGFCSAIYQP